MVVSKTSEIVVSGEFSPASLLKSVFFGKTLFMQHYLITYGYVAVFVLTVLESACFPIPSEVTLAFGGALCSTSFAASSGDQPLNLVLVIVVGIIGSVVGSFVAYVVGRTGGRALVDRWGKYVFLTHSDLDKAHAWFEKKGDVAVLVGRVIPLVRSVISLPAGVAEMQPLRFGIFTTLGVSVWVSLFTILGYNFSDHYEQWTKGVGWVGYIIGGVIAGMITVFIYHRYKQIKKERGTSGKHAAK
jgi:membrane protein DedA with SNARE-associated domain